MNAILTLLAMGYLCLLAMYCMHIGLKALSTGRITAMMAAQTFDKQTRPFMYWTHWATWMGLCFAVVLALAARIVFTGLA